MNNASVKAITNYLARAWRILLTHGFRVLVSRGFNDARRRTTKLRQWSAVAGLRIRLLARLNKGVHIRYVTEPLVSVVIPVQNNLAQTRRCLLALVSTTDVDTVPLEIIVVDDCSTDGSWKYLALCKGIRVVRLETNGGFFSGANAGAKIARGRFIHFLQSDACVRSGWLSSLLEAFAQDDKIAAVGSQLRSTVGTIAGAGGIVWRDGSVISYGRDMRCDDPRIAFARDVDYCPATSLMVRADIFQRIGGFSEELASSGYGDVDLCFSMRQMGFRVVYEPTSEVSNIRGAYRTDVHSEAQRDQPLYVDAFAAKWRRALDAHLEGHPQRIELAARRLQGNRTILVVDSHVPFEDRSAGDQRMFAVLELLRRLRWNVVFMPEDGKAYEPFTARLRRIGIETWNHRGSAANEIMDLPHEIDVAWFCRPEIMDRCFTVLKTRDPKTPVIYDTVDLHYIRLKGQEAITGKQTQWESMRELELRQARRADAVIVTSSNDHKALSAFGIDARVIPIIEKITPLAEWSARRSSVVFLGNYSHAPNVDAAQFLVREIMPLVWASDQTMQCVLAGADPPSGIRRLAAGRVRVPGYQANLTPIFDSAIAMVAPLRFGAGMKGKIVLSLARGVPVITTPIGAEGIPISSGVNGFITTEPSEFANAVLSLYRNRKRWGDISKAGQVLASGHAPEYVITALHELLEDVVLAKSPV